MGIQWEIGRETGWQIGTGQRIDERRVGAKSGCGNWRGGDRAEVLAVVGSCRRQRAVLAAWAGRRRRAGLFVFPVLLVLSILLLFSIGRWGRGGQGGVDRVGRVGTADQGRGRGRVGRRNEIADPTAPVLPLRYTRLGTTARLGGGRTRTTTTTVWMGSLRGCWRPVFIVHPRRLGCVAAEEDRRRLVCDRYRRPALRHEDGGVGAWSRGIVCGGSIN